MNQVYEALMNTLLIHWEAYTPNSEIAAGIKEFQEHMEPWVRKYTLSPGDEQHYPQTDE